MIRMSLKDAYFLNKINSCKCIICIFKPWFYPCDFVSSVL